MARREYAFTGMALLALALASSLRAQENAQEIMARDPAKLVELLQDPAATVFEKAKACQRLAVVGTEEAIPALVALLPDEQLNLYGRFALEAIPGPAVDSALREAAKTLQGRPLVGVVGSLGQRRDAQAVGLLVGLLPNSDAAVASAAAGALGRIGTSEAARALRQALAGESPVKTCLGDAGLACADSMAAAGRPDAALVLYQAVGAAANVPKHQKLAAVAGQIRVRKAAARNLLLEQLRSADDAFFGLGLALVRELPGADVTAALEAELDKLAPARRALLQAALDDRARAAGAAPPQ